MRSDIRTKLTLPIGFFMLAIMAAIFGLNYFVVRNSLIALAQEDLVRAEKTMYRAYQALLSTAINNYLRGITETNLDMVKAVYAEYRAGRMSEQEAKDAVRAGLSSRTIGNSGYFAVVEKREERLYLDVHPFLRGEDCTDTEGCREWGAVKNGYLEYDWQNPADNRMRKKAAYIAEFAPWNWIIGASSYRDEFVELVKIEDLKKLIKPVRIKASGYFLVFDENYRVLIHPEFENIDGRTLLDSQGRRVLERIRSARDGYLTYMWKNPSDPEERLKYAFVIDEVSDRVEMEQRLRQSQKMDAIGQLAGGIAHDFNNMLSGIMGAAELLRVKAGPANQPLVKIISTAAGRARDLILKLMAFSRKEKVAFSPLDIHSVIDDTVAILKRTIDKKIAIFQHLDAELHTIMGDLSLIQNSLLNIGINAGHAMPEGGTLSFSTRAIQLDEVFCQQNPFEIRPGWFIEVAIRDTGCGIEPANIKRIFEPFFTTKQQGKGTGLGLAAVYGTVIQHGGAISVYSEVDRGTEFHLLLPLCEGCRDEMAAPDAKAITGHGCVLVIDDEPIVRMTARLMLERLGYHTLEAADGQEGVDLYCEHGEAIDLVLLDMLMPVMEGVECFRLLRRQNPAVRIIISSVFSRDVDLAEMKNEGLCAFIRKPYNLAELSREVARALAGRNSDS